MLHKKATRASRICFGTNFWAPSAASSMHHRYISAELAALYNFSDTEDFFSEKEDESPLQWSLFSFYIQVRQVKYVLFYHQLILVQSSFFFFFCSLQACTAGLGPVHSWEKSSLRPSSHHHRARHEKWERSQRPTWRKQVPQIKNSWDPAGKRNGRWSDRRPDAAPVGVSLAVS